MNLPIENAAVELTGRLYIRTALGTLIATVERSDREPKRVWLERIDAIATELDNKGLEVYAELKSVTRRFERISHA